LIKQHSEEAQCHKNTSSNPTEESGERVYLPICDCSALAALLWGLVNFCTNRTLLRIIEARSFDMELLCFNLLSAYILKSNKAGNSVASACTQHKTKNLLLNVMCSAASLSGRLSEKKCQKFLSVHVTGNDSFRAGGVSLLFQADGSQNRILSKWITSNSSFENYYHHQCGW